jgi:hypothetical protein
MYKLCLDEPGNYGRYNYGMNDFFSCSKLDLDVAMSSPPCTPPKNYQGECLIIYGQLILMQEWIMVYLDSDLKGASRMTGNIFW